MSRQQQHNIIATMTPMTSLVFEFWGLDSGSLGVSIKRFSPRQIEEQLFTVDLQETIFFVDGLVSLESSSPTVGVSGSGGSGQTRLHACTLSGEPRPQRSGVAAVRWMRCWAAVIEQSQFCARFLPA